MSPATAERVHSGSQQPPGPCFAAAVAYQGCTAALDAAIATRLAEGAPAWQNNTRNFWHEIGPIGQHALDKKQP
eukprot:jgi/Chrzof1/156/Cz01g05130.t1